jgi:type I restriction enzyme S subunit
MHRNGKGLYPAYGANGEKARTDKFLCDEPSIIVGRKGSAGELTLTENRFWPLDVSYYVAFDRKHYDLRFIYYLLKRLNLPRLAKGVKPGLNRNEAYALPVSVPLLPEQRRVAGVLDEGFKAISSAEANTQGSLESARRVFYSQLDAVFRQRSPQWPISTLGSAYDVRDGTHDSPSYHKSGFPLITSKNLTTSGLSFHGAKLISKRDYDAINKRSAVHRGDVLLAMIGTIGNPTIVDVEPTFAIKNVALIKINDRQDSRFLRYALSTSATRERMSSEAKGTTQRFVGLGYLRMFPIPTPQPHEQRLVADSLDQLQNAIEALIRIYKSKLAALTELRQSLLYATFNGQL